MGNLHKTQKIVSFSDIYSHEKADFRVQAYYFYKKWNYILEYIVLFPLVYKSIFKSSLY